MEWKYPNEYSRIIAMNLRGLDVLWWPSEENSFIHVHSNLSTTTTFWKIYTCNWSLLEGGLLWKAGHIEQAYSWHNI